MITQKIFNLEMKLREIGKEANDGFWDPKVKTILTYVPYTELSLSVSFIVVYHLLQI